MDTEKIQRAVDYFKAFRTEIDEMLENECNPKTIKTLTEQIEPTETALACMEKQVLKAVVNGHYDGSNDCYYGKCPSCGKEIYDYANDKFCGECCQALDWESEAEHD
jgi:hypothetical protein